MGRKADISRKTNETDIQLSLELDGSGVYKGTSGVPFLDHMLNLWTRHGMFDLNLTAKGDYEIDDHHTVEDIGICLGRALDTALGDKFKMKRYGTTFTPMDEALIMVSLDISGRPYLAFDVEITNAKVGQFDTELVEEFLRAFVNHAGVTLHVKMLSGKNTHHIIESIFKGFGRALREAVTIDDKVQGILSTKGQL